MKASKINVLLRVFILMIVGVLLFFNQKKTNKINKKLKEFTFLDFDLFFNKLLNHKLESHYVGIASNNTNCIYFDAVENKINFEYEVKEQSQINFAKKLVQFATNNNFEIVKTSYGNKTNYDKNDAVVYQIISNLDANKAEEISKELFTTIFNCDTNTKFNIIT